jgi:DNA-3-methyladenine glycosylase
MFGRPGLAYVYFTYGCHHCFNVVCEPEGLAGAVLIRALEPLEGLEGMVAARGSDLKLKNLTNGPGKLCQALGIDRSFYGIDLLSNPHLYLAQGIKIPANRVVQTTRIGISKAQEMPWRFYVADNPWVSVKLRRHAAS